MAEPASIPSPGPTAEEPARKPWTPHPALIGIFLIAAIALTFYPVARSQFVTYDDPDYITENAHVKGGLGLENVEWAFRTGHAGNWHPVTWLSHMLDVQLFQLNSAGHHIVNVLFHTVNSILLFILVLRWTGRLWRSAFVAGLFALHPLHVESVAWVAERKDVLSAFFFLLTLIAYTGYARSDRQRHRLFLYLTSLAFFGLGLMSKPMLVTVPFVLLLIDFWPLQRLRLPMVGRLLLEKVPFLALTLVSCIVTLIVQKEAEQSLSLLSISARVGNTLISYARYIGKIFWPFNLATPYPLPGHWPTGEIALAALLLFTLTAAACACARAFPFATVGWFWFLGMLVPVIGLVQVGEQAMADRYTYLPLIGLFIALVWAAGEICARIGVPILGAVCAGCVVLAMSAVRANNQVRYWHDSEVLYRHDVGVTSGNFIAYHNLGSYQDNKGLVDEALTNYLKAAEIEPQYPDPQNNIGVIYASRKKYPEAISRFEAALRGNPGFIGAHANLANCLRELGRFEEAIPHYRAVLQKKPEDTAALNGLGTALAAQGRFDEAVPYYEASLRSKPRQAAAHYDLANALLRLRHVDEAVHQYRLALDEKPDDVRTLHDLGVALAMKGNLDEAVVDLRQAVRAEPQNVGFALSLGKLLLVQRNATDALPVYAEAARLAPNNPEAHAGLGSALAATGKLDEAVTQFETSLALRPANPAVHLSLGKTLAAQGKTEAAREQYEEALRLKPDFAPANEELNKLGAGKTE